MSQISAEFEAKVTEYVFLKYQNWRQNATQEEKQRLEEMNQAQKINPKLGQESLLEVVECFKQFATSTRALLNQE